MDDDRRDVKFGEGGGVVVGTEVLLEQIAGFGVGIFRAHGSDELLSGGVIEEVGREEEAQLSSHVVVGSWSVAKSSDLLHDFG